MRRIPLSVAAMLGVVAAACGEIAPGPSTPASGPGGEYSARASDTATPMPSDSVLPDLHMPGARSSPAGQYGWTGALGSRTGMHQVVQQGGTSRQVQLVFAVENDCFGGGAGEVPAPVIVAGLNARYAEAFDNHNPVVLFMPARGVGQRTSAYALPVDDRTLCVYLTWDPTTTPDELSSARQVVDSIRGQAHGANGVRIIFTLPGGWDTG